MNLVPTATQLQSIFAQAAAPAFLLAGVAAFVSILMSRLAAIVDRIRYLSAIAESDPVSGKLKGDIPYLKRRALLLHRAVYLALLAGIATTLLLIVMSGSAFMGLQHIYGAGLLFGIATVLFTLSLFKFAQEIRVALYEINQL
jgi:hypothetical protein